MPLSSPVGYPEMEPKQIMTGSLHLRLHELLQSLVASFDPPLSGDAAALLDAAAVQRLQGYLDLLVVWNKKMDLVGPGGEDAIVERHILDSLALALVIHNDAELKGARSLVDVGTGAGLPGIVVACVMPQLNVVLVDSREKRCLFLSECIRRLSLSNAVVSRQDFIKSPKVFHVEHPVLVTSRALGSETEFFVYVKQFAPSGFAIQMVGPSWTDAVIAQAESLSLIKVLSYQLPSSPAKLKLAISKIEE